jgi:hypothetical protein
VVDVLQLGTSYLPGRVYFQKCLYSKRVDICGGNPFQKQTLRNRTYILSPNGIQRLTVPVMHTGGAPVTDAEIKIDYSLPWIREHKGALEAAYNTSPFFEFFRDDLFAIYDSQPEKLFDLNFRILQLLLKKSKAVTDLVAMPETAIALTDFALINGKQMPDDNTLSAYPQVFGYKYGFVRGLSVIDEMANAYIHNC